MLNILLNSPTNVYCNNEVVYKNVTILDSTLNKKMYLILYHFCHKAVVAGIMHIAKENFAFVK